MTTTEKVAYLKGLADGLELGKETKEQKLISAIIDVLETVAQDLDDLEENALDLGEEIDALSDDLADVEEIIYGDDECCCEDYDDYFDDMGEGDEGCCCGGHHHDDEPAPEGEEGCCHGHGHHHGHEHDHEHGGCCGGHGHHHGGALYEITCPGCSYKFTIDDEVLSLGSINCPSCGGVLEFDLDGEGEKPENGDEGGCCCGHHHDDEPKGE